MNNKNFITNNYNINYNIFNYNEDICKLDVVCDKLLIRDLYKMNLYKRLIDYLQYLVIEDTKDENYNMSILTDYLTSFIFSYKINDYDYIFNKNSPFTQKNIDNYIQKNCININNKELLLIKKLFIKLSDLYDECILLYEKNKYEILNIKYEFQYEILLSKNVYINLCIDDEYVERLNIEKILYKNNIKLDINIFNHLIKLFNTKIYNKFDNEIIDKLVIEYIYIVYMRYYIISSGNNQSSILPSLKKILKDNLGIKIELFSSVLNSSMTNFGSLFYDIEWVFGSLGNYFNMNIISGYYEMNPPYDNCLINNMFNKILNDITNAQNNKKQLLFFIILSNSYFKKNELPNDIHKYIKFNKTISKNNFPFIRYNRSFKKTNVSTIIDVRIIICHTSYIKKIYFKNTRYFDIILSKWYSKKNKN